MTPSQSSIIPIWKNQMGLQIRSLSSFGLVLHYTCPDVYKIAFQLFGQLCNHLRKQKWPPVLTLYGYWNYQVYFVTQQIPSSSTFSLANINGQRTSLISGPWRSTTFVSTTPPQPNLNIFHIFVITDTNLNVRHLRIMILAQLSHQPIHINRALLYLMEFSQRRSLPSTLRLE